MAMVAWAATVGCWAFRAESTETATSVAHTVVVKAEVSSEVRLVREVSTAVVDLAVVVGVAVTVVARPYR